MKPDSQLFASPDSRSATRILIRGRGEGLENGKDCDFILMAYF